MLTTTTTSSSSRCDDSVQQQQQQQQQHERILLRRDDHIKQQQRRILSFSSSRRIYKRLIIFVVITSTTTMLLLASSLDRRFRLVEAFRPAATTGTALTSSSFRRRRLAFLPSTTTRNGGEKSVPRRSKLRISYSSTSSMMANDTTSTITSNTVDLLQQQQQQQQMKSTTASASSTKSTTATSTNTRTLYDVLGATMNDTRAELKRKYVTLAKQCHPDAQITMAISSNNNNNSTTEAAVLDFNEIATAYSILCDPLQRRRYDRSLRAANLTENIASFFTTFSEPITELTVSALENLAFPLLKRTTATTLSVYQAAMESTSKISNNNNKNDNRNKVPTTTTTMDSMVMEATARNPDVVQDTTSSATVTSSSSSSSSTFTRDMSNNNNNNKNMVVDLTRTIETAFQAAVSASKKMDIQEWTTQAQTLQEQAIEEYKQAVNIRNQLQTAANERLKLALHTTQAGLTAAEATILLQSFQQQQGRTTATTTSDNESDDDDNVDDAGNRNMLSLEEIQLAKQYPRHKNSINDNNNSNNNGGPTIWQRLNFLRLSVEKEIAVLRQVENNFLQHQQYDIQAQEAFQTAVRERLLAHTALLQAQANETAARVVYEAAMAVRQDKQEALNEIVTKLYSVEHAAAVSSTELERLQSAVSHQSETVRTALCRKERVVSNKNSNQQSPSSSTTTRPLMMEEIMSIPGTIRPMGVSGSGMIVENDTRDRQNNQNNNNNNNAIRLEQLARLRQQERDLAAKAAELEFTAAKLLSQANKLKQKIAAAQEQQP